MNGNTFDEDNIPELIGSLEGSVAAPDPAAIHAGLSKRRAVRKRLLGVAGAVVAVAALGAGALALTGDDTTTTETVSDDGSRLGGLFLQSDESPAVAVDSAPRLETRFDPDRSLRDQLVGRVFAVGAVRGDSQGFTANSGQVIFNLDEFELPGEYGFPSGTDTITYTDVCHGSAYEIEWTSSLNFSSLDQAESLQYSGIEFRVVSEVPTATLAKNVICSEAHGRAAFDVGDGITVGQAPGSDVLTMGVICPPNALCAPKGLWTVDLLTTETTSATEPVVPTPGETAPTTGAPTTTTTTEPVIAGPPAFSPSSNTVLSGRWEPVGMWKDGAAINLGGFGGNISVFGRSLSGNDGCNSHGSGGFYATPEGQAQLRPGGTDTAGCQESEILAAFNAGTFGANRWGRTSVGNLVLTNGSVVIEFALAEAAPTGSLQGVSAPLNTIWRSAQVADYDNFGPEGSGVTLTFTTEDDGLNIAVVVVEGCAEFGFAPTFVERGEGPISFEPLNDVEDGGPCELSEDAQLALDAMSRANYFVTAEGNVQFWDGPQPLAVFAHEEE